VKKASGRKGNGSGDSPGKRMKSPGIRDLPAPGAAGKGCAAKKLKSLRTAVAEGNYRVESKKIADKIVDAAVREIRDRTR